MSENTPVRPHIYNTKRNGTTGQERVSGYILGRESEELERPEEE